MARPEPAVELAPPVSPNLVRPREIPGARAIARNTIETLVFRGLSTPIALVLVVVQSRFLDPAGRGAFVIAVLGVTIFSRLLGQLGAAVTSRTAGSEEADLRGLVHRALGIGGALGLLGSVAVFAAAAGEGVGLAAALLAGLALVPNVVWQTVSGVLLGLARVRLWNYIQLAPPVLTLVGMLVLVVALDAGVAGAVGAWTLANAATATLALAATRSTWWPPALPNLMDATGRALVRLALIMGAVQVVNLVSYRIELFILRRFETLREVGVYSIAMQAAEAIWLVAAAVATAVTAPVVHETDERAAALVARAAGRALLLTAAVAAVVGIAAPFVVPLLFGDAFSPAVEPLAVLLPGVVVYAPVTVLVVYLSVRRRRPRLSLLVSVVGMTVTAAGALALIPPLGTLGAALASTSGYVAGGALAWILFVRVARLRWSGRTP